MNWAPFAIPITMGLLMVIVSFVLFRRGKIPPKYFGIALVLSMILVTSVGIYSLIVGIRGVFSIVYAFVLAFGVGIVGIIFLLIYIVLLIGKLRKETNELWQEIALSRVEQGPQEESLD
jgi:hypothetical protein